MGVFRRLNRPDYWGYWAEARQRVVELEGVIADLNNKIARKERALRVLALLTWNPAIGLPETPDHALHDIARRALSDAEDPDEQDWRELASAVLEREADED